METQNLRKRVEMPGTGPKHRENPQRNQRGHCDCRPRRRRYGGRQRTQERSREQRSSRKAAPTRQKTFWKQRKGGSGGASGVPTCIKF